MFFFKKYKYILLISLFLNNYVIAETSCFVIAENNYIIKKAGNCDKRWSPCSTFKIAIALMGYDSEILINEALPEWNYKPEYIGLMKRWKQPHNPSLWFTNSCIWYSRVITKKLGIRLFGDYINRLGYGNQDISGDKGKHNGLTKSWLSSSLAISPNEQIAFLQKLIHNELPICEKAQETTKNIMLIEDLQNRWKLYGKTGVGFQRGKRDKLIEWFIGFATRDNRSIVFAYLITDKNKAKAPISLRAKAALKVELAEVLDEIENT